MRRIYSSRTDPAYIPGLSDVEEKPGELRTHPPGTPYLSSTLPPFWVEEGVRRPLQKQRIDKPTDQGSYASQAHGQVVTSWGPCL